MKKILSEFFASLFLGFFGLGAVFVLVKLGVVENAFQFSILFGLIIAFVIILFNPISGAQFNPGVTICMTIFRGHPKNLLVPFIVAQVLGWGVGVLGVFAVYNNVFTRLMAEDPSFFPPSMFYCSTVQENMIAASALEFIMTAMLLIAILAMIDDRFVNKPGDALFPWAIAVLIVFLISFGGYTGCGINGARDFGPRLAGLLWCLIRGIDPSPIFAGGQWLMYIVAPCAGAVFGGWFFDKCICSLLLSDEKVTAKEKEKVREAELRAQ